jgi:predicted ATPase
MHLRGITILSQEFPDRNSYPFNLSVLQKTESLSFTRPVTFFVGQNGTGKSTLLKAICRRCDIHIWEDTGRTRCGYNCYEDDLYKYLQTDWVNGSVHGSYFASQIFQDFARFLDEWAHGDPGILSYFGGNSLLTQSHGQSMIGFFEAFYQRKGLHFLDEPETALSPMSQIKLLQVLKRNSDAGHAQFIISTHSPILLAFPGAAIYSFDKAPVAAVQYEETELYHLYKDFINDPGKYLNEL